VSERDLKRIEVLSDVQPGRRTVAAAAAVRAPGVPGFVRGALSNECPYRDRLGIAEERWSVGEHHPYSGRLFLGRVVGQFQAREPRRLAVSEACPENGCFHEFVRFGQFFPLEDLSILRPNIVCVHRIPSI
jgi:hypothetical protein